MKNKFDELARLLLQVETILSEIKSEAKELSIKHSVSTATTRDNFIQKTSKEFVEWCETDPIPLGERLRRTDYLAKLIEFSPSMSYVTSKRFSDWLRIYCDYKGFLHFTARSNGSRFSLIYEAFTSIVCNDDLCPSRTFCSFSHGRAFFLAGTVHKSASLRRAVYGANVPGKNVLWRVLSRVRLTIGTIGTVGR